MALLRLSLESRLGGEQSVEGELMAVHVRLYEELVYLPHGRESPLPPFSIVNELLSRPTNSLSQALLGGQASPLTA